MPLEKIQTVIVSDIFGKTKALERLCARIAAQYEIIDPYSGKDMGFDDEARAYACFMDTMGVNGYADHLLKQLERCQRQVILIGFSVGASAIWQISESLDEKITRRAAGFYGSQIRHNLDLNPSVEITLCLPVFEPAFSIADLTERLETKKNVRVLRTGYRHGFMNALSVNFNREGYLDFASWLSAWGSNGNNSQTAFKAPTPN
jgi:dienelactone hydrolase